MIDTIIQGDALAVLATLPQESVDMCVTSPPYFGLRDYGVHGQMGLETTPQEYVSNLVNVFKEVRRTLKPQGTLWLNMGDSYVGGGGFWANAPSSGKSKSGRYGNTGALVRGSIRSVNGLKSKDLIGIPWRVAFALQEDGWYLRSDIIWHKPNAMPESVKDRPTKAHEYLFLLAKNDKYYYNADAVREPHTEKDRRGYNRIAYKIKAANEPQSPSKNAGYLGQHPEGRNCRTIWTIPTKPYKGAHFATFPPALIEPCIKAGCPEGGIILDPFFGAGTTGVVAKNLGRHYIGIELNKNYIDMAQQRIDAL